MIVEIDYGNLLTVLENDLVESDFICRYADEGERLPRIDNQRDF